MILSCNICREKMISTHDIVVTSNCGHLYHRSCFEQWVKTNPTCPTCRCKQKTKAIKIFFTTENDTSESQDAVIERLEEGFESMRVNYDASRKELETVKAEQEKTLERLASLENELFAKTDKLVKLTTAAKSLKAETKRLTEENGRLQRSVKECTTLQRLKIVLEGSYDEVAEMMKNTSCDSNSVETLCTFVAQLKKCNEREKEKVHDLRRTNHELIKEIKDLKRHLEELKSHSPVVDENSPPVRKELQSVERNEIETIDLDESYESLVTFGVDRPIKVLDQRKFERRTDNSRVPIFSKASDASSSRQGTSSSFAYDGFGGSKRFWPSDPSSKPYQRPTSSKNKQISKPKVKGQQPSLKGYLGKKD